MRSSFHAATLLALALTVAPLAFAGEEGGEKHSCCKKDAAKTASNEKCDPKNCPPGSCDKEKHAATATKAKTTAKPAAKPAA